MNTFFLSCIAAIGIASASASPPAIAEEPIEVIGRAPEHDYVSQVRTMLTRQMRLPTGREASLTQPEGTVSVWFVLARDGSLVERGIEQSSQSGLLDTQARTLVSRATYAALPSQAWAGENGHRFVVTYRFARPSSQTDADTRTVLAVR